MQLRVQFDDFRHLCKAMQICKQQLMPTLLNHRTNSDISPPQLESVWFRKVGPPLADKTIQGLHPKGSTLNKCDDVGELLTADFAGLFANV